MEISSIMTPDPVTVAVDADLQSAMDLMDPHKIRHLPVLDGARLVGIVSDRDLLQETGWLRGQPTHQKKTIGEIMQSPAVTVTPAESIISVAVEIVTRGIGCLPVVSEKDSTLIGILTEMDLLKAFCQAHTEGKLHADGNPQIASHMAIDPISCGPDDSLGDAANVCWRHFIRHLPVVEENRLLGLVTDRDIRRTMGSGEADELNISGVMTRQPITVQPDDTLVDAAEVMLRYKISCLPVVKEDQFVGILTTTDLVDHCMNTLWEA